MLNDDRPVAGQKGMRQGEHAAHTASLARAEGSLMAAQRRLRSSLRPPGASTAAPSSADAPALRVTRLARSGSASP